MLLRQIKVFSRFFPLLYNSVFQHESFSMHMGHSSTFDEYYNTIESEAGGGGVLRHYALTDLAN